MTARDGPRLNRDDDFVLFRTDTVAAILPDRSHLDDCVAALREVGVAGEEVSVLQGEDGARVLDLEGTQHGNWARLVRSFQNLGTAANERVNYANALKRGCVAIFVPARNNEEADAFGRILAATGGRRILHFGHRWGEQLPF
jgi:hypothetical protein